MNQTPPTTSTPTRSQPQQQPPIISNSGPTTAITNQSNDKTKTQNSTTAPTTTKYRPKSSIQSGIKLSVAAKHFLILLEELDRYIVHLSVTPAIQNAIRRYETIWLPLAANYGLVGPPIDVHLVWLVHMMSPVSYKQDCLDFTNKLIDHRCLSNKELQKARETSRKTWQSKYPNEPFDFDPNSSAKLDCMLDQRANSSKLTHRLREPILKHLHFYYQVSLPHYNDVKFLDDAVSRYKKFVFLQLQNPDRVLVPLIDVVLIWHTHKLHPSVYSKDTKCAIDKILLKSNGHPDLLWIQQTLHNPPDNPVLDHQSTAGAATNLLLGPSPLEMTAELWSLVFKERYRKPGTQYRGRTVNGKLGTIGLTESYLMSTKSAQVQVKSLLIDPHTKLDKYTIQLTNPLLAFQPFTNYMAKLKSPDKFWPHKPGQKFIANTSLVTGTVDSFSLELVDRRGLFCSNNSILASKKICLVDYIENFMGTECQPIDLQFDLGKERDTSLGKITISLVLFPPERHATRLRVLVGENAILRVLLSDNNFWGWPTTLSTTNTIPTNQNNALCGANQNNSTVGDTMTNSMTSDVGVECYFLSHSIVNHIKKEIMTVRIIHSVALEKSIIQVLYHNQIVAIAETIGSEQLPSPNSTQNHEMMLLDQSRGERAVLIKDTSGDWGLLIGRWDPPNSGPLVSSSQTNSGQHHHHHHQQQQQSHRNHHHRHPSHSGNHHHHHHHHHSPHGNGILRNGISSEYESGNQDDDYCRFSIRCYWLRGEWKVQYSHIPDSMNSWSVVLNDVSFDLATGEIHISRQCNDIAQSVCLAFSCAVCLALCRPYQMDYSHHRLSNSTPEIKPPLDTFNTSLFLSPNIEIVSIPPLRDYLLKKNRNSSHQYTTNYEQPSYLLMCIAAGINHNEYLPTLRNIKLKRTINKNNTNSLYSNNSINMCTVTNSNNNNININNHSNNNNNNNNNNEINNENNDNTEDHYAIINTHG